MSSKDSKSDKLAAEKTERIARAKSKLLDGSISAISVDACIFTENGNRLGHGVLKRLEQFKGKPFQLVFSEVALREVHAHLTTEGEAARASLNSAIRSVGKHWELKADKDALLNGILGAESARDLATKKMKNFVERCGALVLEAKDFVEVHHLLDRYFKTHPPFERSDEKKSEFPDAIALLSLEKWAKKIGTCVLLVTKDKGCKRFCDESSSLFVIDDLAEALLLIQERDSHLTGLCTAIEANIRADRYPDLLADMEESIGRNIWDIEWTTEADAPYYYEDDLQDVELVRLTYPGSQGSPLVRPLDYDGETLVVQSSVTADIRATGTFAFSVKDGIDHDMVTIGGAEVVRNTSVTLEVLLTFENLTEGLPEITQIELVPARRKIDFGYVEPDYSDEDPTHEYY